jgi:hypothetical protein
VRLNSVCGRRMDEWVGADRGKQKYSEKNCPRALCPPQTPLPPPHELAWHWTRASPVRRRRLSTWAMVRPWSGPDCVVSNIWFVSELRFGPCVDGRGHDPVWSPCVRRPTISLSQGCWSPRRDFNLRYSECVEESSAVCRDSQYECDMWSYATVVNLS